MFQCFFGKLQTVPGANSQAHFCIGPSGSHIDEGIDVKPSVANDKVDGVNLH